MSLFDEKLESDAQKSHAILKLSHTRTRKRKPRAVNLILLNFPKNKSFMTLKIATNNATVAVHLKKWVKIFSFRSTIYPSHSR